MTIEGNNKPQRESFIERIEGFVNNLFLKKTLDSIITKITGGDPEKWAKLRVEMQKIVEEERTNPNTFDPETDDFDEIDPDLL